MGTRWLGGDYASGPRATERGIPARSGPARSASGLGPVGFDRDAVVVVAAYTAYIRGSFPGLVHATILRARTDPA